MRRQAGIGLVLALAVGCGREARPGAGAEPIDRETFVETYVELRLAALRSPDYALAPAQRDEILRRHGVRADALLAFADAHGPHVEYMSEVWSEIERRLEARRTEEDGLPR